MGRGMDLFKMCYTTRSGRHGNGLVLSVLGALKVKACWADFYNVTLKGNSERAEVRESAL